MLIKFNSMESFTGFQKDSITRRTYFLFFLGCMSGEVYLKNKKESSLQLNPLSPFEPIGKRHLLLPQSCTPPLHTLPPASSLQGNQLH
jgi:hypothetical protein